MITAPRASGAGARGHDVKPAILARERRYHGGMLFARILLLCALATALLPAQSVDLLPDESLKGWTRIPIQIGRASCRERV